MSISRTLPLKKPRRRPGLDVKAGLLEELQYRLRFRIRLREHRGRGLNEDLIPNERDHARCHILIAYA
jgi:hypothetical protein